MEASTPVIFDERFAPPPPRLSNECPRAVAPRETRFDSGCKLPEKRAARRLQSRQIGLSSERVPEISSPDQDLTKTELVN